MISLVAERDNVLVDEIKRLCSEKSPLDPVFSRNRSFRNKIKKEKRREREATLLPQDAPEIAVS